MPNVNFTATITPNGTISVTTHDPNDFERARQLILSIMSAVAGDETPIVYSGCLDPSQADAIARRLARMIIGEGAI